MARGSLEEELLESAVEVREEADEGLGVGCCAEEDDWEWDWDEGFEGVGVEEDEEGARLLGTIVLRWVRGRVCVRLVLDANELRSQLGWKVVGDVVWSGCCGFP